MNRRIETAGVAIAVAISSLIALAILSPVIAGAMWITWALLRSMGWVS